MTNPGSSDPKTPVSTDKTKTEKLNKGQPKPKPKKHVKKPDYVPDPPRPTNLEYVEMRNDVTYGDEFKYEYSHEGDTGDGIQIDNPKDWETKYIVYLPVWDMPAPHKLFRLHKRVARQFAAFFAVAEAKNVLNKILTQAGGFVARTRRLKSGKRSSLLSNHALGAAIDLNSEWNGQGTTPAKRGKKGSLCELADFCADFGLYWGGWYKTLKSLDGMHFEAVKVLSDTTIDEMCIKHGVDPKTVPTTFSSNRPPRPFTDKDAKAASEWNKKQGYDKETTARIQRGVGAEETEEFDDATAKKVAEFQKKHGLECDGKVGKKTLGKLEQLEKAAAN